ncbi:hypothetical protein GH714_043241 [Hevea brasiliensis]|uniref:Anthocyanidin 3-O-glucosyltransferase n=1 Tax=Hevea brasiliensis TaxID=3981 RepID=A0A6A6K341_HEVBR|nr:hypothetical protein GH714_043241 [Hevea brasiliensis]
MRSLRQQHYPILLNWFQSHPSPPFAIISDFFLGWTHQLACQLAIPRLVFSPSGAFAFSVTTSLWRNQPQTENPNNVDFRTSKEGDPDREFFRDCFLANFESWGVVINSFVELERVHIEHLKGNSGIGSDRVWSVGPLLLHDDGGSIGSLSRGGSSSVPCQQVITWLEEKGDNSVVYICFGSREMLTCKQMDELASGLEKSGINFIWSVRQPNERHASASVGFYLMDSKIVWRERFYHQGMGPPSGYTEESGGGRLTHCGWNSVLEGIASGVVMLTWPMGADQFINAELLVDQLGVGIRVGEDTQKILDSDELARILAESVAENLRRDRDPRR